MADRAERLARNEDYVRDINESLREKHVHAPVVRSGPLPFVCECASMECTEAVELTMTEYRSVRQNARRFVVVPGHEVVDAEVVVETTDRFMVVEKVGETGQVAAELETKPAELETKPG